MGYGPAFMEKDPLLTEMLSFVVLPVIISMTESSPNESGESVYKNGEPVKEEHYPMEEFSDYSYVVGRYYLPDGSMELTLSYNFIDSSGANLGKDIKSFFYRIWQGNRPWESNDRDRTVGFWKLETLYSTKWNRTSY